MGQDRTNRINWIDFGKGITIFIVFLGHLFLGLYQSNRFEEANSFLLFAIQLFYMFHIPVFFALSGYFFKPVKGIVAYFEFIKNKTIALGLPYVFYSIIHVTLQKMAGSAVREMANWSDLLNLYKMPIAVGWYLYTLWWIFLIFGFLSIWLKKISSLFIISVLLFGVALIYPIDNYPLQKMMLWSIAFMLGAFLRELSKYPFYSLVRTSRVIFIVIALLFLGLWWQTNPDLYVSYYSPGVFGIIFLNSVLLAFATFPYVTGGLFEVFNKIGRDSLGIYLFHAPILSMFRIILFKIGVENLYLHILGGVVVCWILTLIAVYIAKRVKFIDFMLYPLKYLK